MKLLFCPYCNDIFNLDLRVKRCTCGRCVGRYDANGTTAVVNGEGYSFAIGNGSFNQAIAHVIGNGLEMKDFRDEDGLWARNSILAWARPHSGPANPHTRVDPNLK